LSCLHHPFGYILFYVLKFPNDVKTVGRYLVLAICHFNWLLAVNTELSGTTRQVPCFIKLFFIPLSVSGKLTGFKPAPFGLLCAWREVPILRQHTFWHA
jgi:hypothetical protein